MRSPFPGMNPYLENPELWPEFHHWIITAIAELLVPQLRPKYRVAVEKLVYQVTDENFVLVGIPDVSVGRSRFALSETSLTKTETELSSIAVESPPVKPISEAYYSQCSHARGSAGRILRGKGSRNRGSCYRY